MTNYGLSSEIRRFIGTLILSAIIGLMLGNVVILLVIGVLGYIAYHLFYLVKLLKCLQRKRLTKIPEASGLWGQVFDYLSRLRRREIREKNKLKSVINRVDATTAALSDAVILLNKDNELKWWNKATSYLLDLKKGDSGNSIINYIRNPKFVAYLESNDYRIPLSLPSPRHIEIQLEFQITRFGEGEALIVVRDVTRIFKLEEMRKDFVANVSHELRTPLTVIKGYLETLEDSHEPSLESSPHWQKAMEQMQQQATRMTTLINDITMLAKLETEENNNHITPVPLKPLLEMICNEAKSIRTENNQAIILHCSDDLQLMGNDRELHSAFSNLITNAVKYSFPEKAIEVSASINLTGNLIVKVQDQGIGIEQEHISRLTERFYRVDSSRSIQTGGTGLGLAIVKHVLLRHEARLQIESIYNQGSTFSCIFPSNRVSKIKL